MNLKKKMIITNTTPQYFQQQGQYEHGIQHEEFVEPLTYSDILQAKR